MSTVDTTSTAPDAGAPAPSDRRAPRRTAPLDTRRPSATDVQRVGEICPTCFTTTSLTGTCDTCD